MRPICASRPKVMTRARTQITGTGMTIWMVLIRANWMVVTSEMVRVVMEAVPNCRKSYTDSFRDLA
ncbi:MAG TPA: hypothetical protein H9719_07875 [Candidatus Intestinimonas stercoravium]|nr:hypothetical protein [Candidatus Intestinimonas stercoravium]